jgi:hypothetical protein
MLLSTSPTGWKEGLLTVGKVVLWYAATGAITQLTGLVNFLALQPETQEKSLYFMLINAVLAGIAKWLKSVQPSEAPTLASPAVG